MLVFIFFLLPFHRSLFKNTIVTPPLVEVSDAKFIPFPGEEKPFEEKVAPSNNIINNTFSPPPPVEKKVESNTPPLVQKREYKIPERLKAEYAWKANVNEKIRRIEQKEESYKIVTPKVQKSYNKGVTTEANEGVTSSLTNYTKMIAFIIRSHWTVPEDLAHRFYGLSAEIEVTLDRDGNITKIDILRSSGNPSFDFYAKESFMKTKRLPLPPKDLFAMILNNGKIVFEFKP